MPAFLTGPLLKYAIIGLVFLGLGATIYVQHLKLAAADAQIAAVKAELGQAVAANAENVAALHDVTADRDASKAAAAQVQTDFTKHKTAAFIQIAKLKKEVADATVQNECPVAPSVLAVLRGLSGTDPASNGDGGAGDKAPSPG